ncbi:hypothetical protein [Kyrpidia spormannii]|uniref:hypothetical protein n=1 Tax=Kyrpidia spormannii TaxID=2055160 RepID=UPI001055B9F3|nr:hypothetical protein [Kyrpidia spormannii]
MKIQLKPSKSGLVVSLLLGLGAVLAIHLLSHGLWLPTRRSQTLTSVVPFGKYLFPLAVIPLTMVLPLVFVRLQYKMTPLRLLVGALVVGVCVVLLSLLYQRGFILIGIILFLWMLDRLHRLSVKRAVTFGVAALVLLFTIRPVVNEVLTISRPTVDTHQDQNVPLRVTDFVRENILSKPNFDNADVWPVVIDFVKRNGELEGSGYLAVPLRFFSPSLRNELNVPTVVDTLNSYYWGESYWKTNFGFNVTMSQELYMNFGLIGLFLGWLPGLLTAVVDRYLSRLQTVRDYTLYVVFAGWVCGGFTSDTAGIVQWSVAILLFALLLRAVGRVRLTSGGINDSPASGKGGRLCADRS